MKKLLCLLLIFIFPCSAFADSPSQSTGIKPYIKIGSAFSFPNTVTDEDDEGYELDLENGGRFGGAIGVKMQDFRAEIEYAYRTYEMEEIEFDRYRLNNGSRLTGTWEADGDGTAHMVMVNGFYDVPGFENYRFFSPFVGAGAGFSWEKASYEKIGETPFDYENKKSGFAFQGMIGNTIHWSENFVSDLSFRYVEGHDFSAEEIGIGLRYIF